MSEKPQKKDILDENSLGDLKKTSQISFFQEKIKNLLTKDIPSKEELGKMLLLICLPFVILSLGTYIKEDQNKIDNTIYGFAILWGTIALIMMGTGYYFKYKEGKIAKKNKKISGKKQKKTHSTTNNLQMGKDNNPSSSQ